MAKFLKMRSEGEQLIKRDEMLQLQMQSLFLSRVNLNLPAYPSAITKEDDKGCIPFTEANIHWVEARREVRKWKLENGFDT